MFLGFKRFNRFTAIALKPLTSRLQGGLRTLVINLLEGMKVKNRAAQLDTFADKFAKLIQLLT